MTHMPEISLNIVCCNASIKYCILLDLLHVQLVLMIYRINFWQMAAKKFLLQYMLGHIKETIKMHS